MAQEHNEHVIPALYEGPMPPPSYQVPPDDVLLWSEEDERIYKVWKQGASKGTRKKFRRFVNVVNREHKEVFSLIEDGVWGLRRLLAFCQKFPQFNLEKHLDGYNNEENVAVIELVREGLDVVKKEQLRCGLEVVCDEQLPQHQQPEKEYLIKEEKIEVKESIDLSQVNRTPVREELVAKKVETQESKRSKKKKKESRQQRLLKFHEKLVQTSGLPPSRLMIRRQKLSKKNLASEFDLFGSEIPPGLDASPSGRLPTVSAPSTLSSPAPTLTAVPPLGTFTLPPSFGISPMTCATTPTWTGGGQVGEGLGTGWPEAGPMTPPNHLYYGSTSGPMNPQTLSSISPYSLGVSVFQPNPPQVPTIGSPAYCFHCLQFGRVFTVSPA